jgi:hypothetical protein
VSACGAAGPDCGLQSVKDFTVTTLWLFREKLAKAGLIEKLFERF